MSLNPSQASTKAKPRLVANGGNSAARPRKARSNDKKSGTGLSLIIPNAQDMAALAPAPAVTRSRMKINAIDLSERDPSVSFKDLVLKTIGDLNGFIVLGNDVLVATYIKTRVTAGGIVLPDKNAEEDRYQGKIGLVLKLGEGAFKYAGAYAYDGTVPRPGDYVAFHTSDTREIGIDGVSCRTVDATLIRMVVPDPDRVY